MEKTIRPNLNKKPIWQPFFEGWVLWIDSFLPLFLLFSFYFSYHAFETKLNRSYLLSGLFLGAGIVLKQVVIPVAFLVGLVFLLARQRKGFSYFILGIIPFPLLMIFYFIKIDVFPDFWYWTVIYNLTTFSQFGKKYPDTPGLLRIVGVFGMSLFSLSFKKKRLVFWIFLFLLGGLASAYARFDFVHFQPVLPFLAIATVLSVDSMSTTTISSAMDFIDARARGRFFSSFRVFMTTVTVICLLL